MKQNLNNKEKKLLRHLLLGASVLGIIFLIYILLLGYNIHNQGTGESSFISLHQAYPSLLFAWIFALAFPFTSLFFGKRYLEKKTHLEKQLDQKNNIITNNAMFAKSIGEGDFYTSSIEQVDRNDLLTRSLLIMRKNLIRGRQTEEDQKWINDGKEIISEVLRNHRTIDDLAYETIREILSYTNLIQGAFYIYHDDKKTLNRVASYAYNRKKYVDQEIGFENGLIGACAYEKEAIYRNEIPEDYATITSGILGDKKPGSILIFPLLSEESLQGVIEIAATDDTIDEQIRQLMLEIAPVIGQTLFNLRVNTKTENLLGEAQELTAVLRENEEELQQNAEEMRMTQEELESTNIELENKIQEVGASKTKLHSLLENASEVIYIFNKQGEIIYASPSTVSIVGFNPDDLLGLQGLDIAQQEYHNLIKENFQKLIDNPYKVVHYTFKHNTKSGDTIWVETSGRNMLDNGAIKGIIFNVRDITLQRLAEKDRRIKGQMQSLSENSPDLIIRFSQDGNLLYVNPVCLRYLGAKSKTLSGKNINETKIDSEVYQFIQDRLEKVIDKQKKIEAEFDFPTNEGERSLSMRFIPEFSDEGEFETILLVGNDLTEMKAIEREISDKNRKLSDSINYAERIQKAIMPDNEHFRNGFGGFMLINQARDVVSGDFPWHYRKDNIHYIAAVDCTGHGVPGALLSFIGYFLLNEIVNNSFPADPATILDRFDQGVKDTLKQEKAGSDTRDGMDIALMKIDLETQIVEFSGAHRPLLHLRDEEFTTLKGDRKSIGGIYGHRSVVKEFTNQTIQLKKKDRVFIYSDGLPDQFGNGNIEKFQTKRIKEAIMDNKDNSMADLENDLTQRINKWRGDYRQIDDILMIGIEI